MTMWSSQFDLEAFIRSTMAKIEALEARIHILEERADRNDEHVSELNFIQPGPTGGYIPINRSLRR